MEVGASLLDVESLKDVVIVDTPGSGDPLVVEEIVRDFLPICDQLSYTFSAASALAVSDLPMLVKIHKDLPFLPVRSVVTRADEFTRDVDARATSANVDNSRIDTFIGELISRIAASVPGLNIGFLTQMCARFSPSRSAAPWEEGADALVPANQR